MTSRDLTENVEQLQIMSSLRIIRDRVVATLDRNPQILTQVLSAVDTTVNAATAPLTRSSPTSRP